MLLASLAGGATGGADAMGRGAALSETLGLLVLQASIWAYSGSMHNLVIQVFYCVV